MIGFVDDCTQRVNKFHDDPQPDALSLTATMERDAQIWNDVLWASGGALEQTKCSYHLIQSAWTKDGHPFLQGGIQPNPIKLFDGQKYNAVYQKSSYESHKTLGCFINPAHNNTSTWQATKAKNDQFVRVMDSNYMTRLEAWTFYTSIYIPSITYAIPMSPLTPQQCTDLNSRFLRVLLPRLGYNRNLSSVLRYTPQVMGGVGLKHLYHQQGLLLLQHAYKYLNSPGTAIGKMLHIAISWTQTFLGVSQCILTDVHQPIPPVGPSILLDLRQFLRHINAHLSISHSPQQQVLRTHDRFIMDIALSQTRWKPKQLIQINSCRRYLQALTIADICTSSGTRLTHETTNAIAPSDNLLRVNRFNQQKPGTRAWITWGKFLRTISTKEGLLYQRLGNWTVPHGTARRRQQFIYNPDSNTLFSHHIRDEYRAHAHLHGNYFSSMPVGQPVEAQGYPTTVVSIMDRLCPLKDFTPIPPPAVLYNATTATYHPTWQADLLRGITNLQPKAVIIHHISRGNIVTCSDGSASETSASFGFIASTRQGLRLAQGHGPAPGSYHNSFRSEAYGVLATMLWAHALRQNWLRQQIQPSHWTHYLDNQSVIKRIQRQVQRKHTAPNTELLPENDVIKEVAALIQQLPWDIELEWVKGHQDSHTPYPRLPLEAQMNCQADKLAEDYHQQPFGTQVPMANLPHSPCRIYIQSQSITRALKRRVYEAATVPIYHQYICKRFGWQASVIDTIDWDTYRTVVTRNAQSRTTLVKHLHDISPTGHIAHRNNPSLPHHCPACQSPYEDNHHVILCAAASRASWRSILLNNLRKRDDSRSDPILLDILQDGIRHHFRSIPLAVEAYPPAYHEVIHTQNAIGWDQLFKARWSRHWVSCQNRYRDQKADHSLAKPGDKWAVQMGHLFLTSWLELWKIRNMERHGQDQAQQETIKRTTILADLTELYTMKHEVCPADRNIFYDSIADHLQRHPNLSQLEDWIVLYRDAIRSSVKTARQLGLLRNRTLLDYPMFNPATLPGQRASLTAGALSG